MKPFKKPTVNKLLRRYQSKFVLLEIDPYPVFGKVLVHFAIDRNMRRIHTLSMFSSLEEADQFLNSEVSARGLQKC